MTATRTPQVTHFADDATLARIRRLELALAQAREALEASGGFIQPSMFADNSGAHLAVVKRNAALLAIEELEKEQRT